MGTPQYALIFVFPDSPPLVTTWTSEWAELVPVLREWQTHDRAYTRGKVKDEDYHGIMDWLLDVGFLLVPWKEIGYANTVGHILMCNPKHALDWRLGRELTEWRTYL